MSEHHEPEKAQRGAGSTTEELEARLGSTFDTVNLGLLDTVPSSVEDSEPYPTPDVEALAAVEQEVADQVATVRDEQSLNIANMGQRGVAHFLLTKDGAELCGGCGQPFPCASWRGDIEPRNQADSNGASAEQVAVENVARSLAQLLNVEVEEARQMVQDNHEIMQAARRSIGPT